MRQLEAIRYYARFGCTRLRKVAESCKKLPRGIAIYFQSQVYIIPAVK